MVVMCHLQNQLVRLGLGQSDWSGLQGGVDIFFVISGFIMWVTTASKPERTSLAFYRDRITRVAPLYWGTTALLVAILLAAPGAAETTRLDWPHLLKSLLFIPAEHPVTGIYQPTLIPGWTLNLEMFFYLIFGGAMAAAGSKLKLRAIIVLAIIATLVIIGRVTEPEGAWAFYIQEMLGEFALGILIGILYSEGRLPRSNWFWIVIAAGALMLLTAPPPEATDSRLIRWGVPAALIVLGSVSLPQSTPRMLERLGDWSYSLYLSHPLTLSASEKLWANTNGGYPIVIFAIFAVAAAIILAALIHHVAEVPMTRWARRRMQFSDRRACSLTA